MADNVTLNTMSGGDVVAADDIGSVKYQRVKITWGPDGTATDVSSAAPIPVTAATPSTLGSGSATVATAGTAVQLPNQAAAGVTIRANTANTGTIYLGASAVTSSNGFPLAAGEAVSLDVANLNTVYVNATVNGEGIRFVWVTP